MGWLLEGNEKARQEISERALALGITGTPDKASHSLGQVTLEDGRTVNAHIVHAVDPIITDGERLVVINRRNDPGKGKAALPGGFLDPTAHGVENAVGAAAREAMEEAGIELKDGTLVGQRNVNRIRDIRIAKGNGLAENYGIHDGDIFMVSTQAVLFEVDDLRRQQMYGKDDALPGSARAVHLAKLNRDKFGSPDHFDMVEAALGERLTALREKAAQENWSRFDIDENSIPQAIAILNQPSVFKAFEANGSLKLYLPTNEMARACTDQLYAIAQAGAIDANHVNTHERGIGVIEIDALEVEALKACGLEIPGHTKPAIGKHTASARR